MTSWQPIDTCPADKPVLVTDGSKIISAIVYREFWGEGYDPVGVTGYDWEMVILFKELTHWMPLPSLPEIPK